MGNTPSGTEENGEKFTPQNEEERIMYEKKMAEKAEKKKKKAQQSGEGDDGELLSYCPEKMKEAEDACAACNRECDIVQPYPSSIVSKIDRNFVLNGSGKLFRWQVLITTGVSANKWPSKSPVSDLCASIETAADKITVDKVRVSVITRGPESGCNPNEAVDLIIFPEFVKYNNVEESQLDALFQYHTAVIAPRHQDIVHKRKEDPGYKPVEKELTDEEKAKITELPELTIKPSQYFYQTDRIEHNAGIKFQYPIDLVEDTFVTLCGHTLRDKRCGVTAPILREQFNAVLDQKHPNYVEKVTIDLVSHVGGHKVAGNVIIHSRGFGSVFYGRVFPEHVEAIVDKTIVQGEVLEPISRAHHNELW